MVPAFIKTTFREIKNSLGRYSAILAIIALGVGFFSGLKVSRKAMVETASDYFSEQNFYDYRFISTLGFEDADIEAFSGADGIKTAAGANSADVIFTEESGSESVYKVISLNAEINIPYVTAGKLPQKENECFADDTVFSEEDIGKSILISDSNEKDTSDMLSPAAFTITGIGKSPLYISDERGTTSAGNGRISGFIYILQEAFTADYYTEIYATAEKSEYIYSDKYNDMTDKYLAMLEKVCENRADARYNDIIAEAEKKISEAQVKLTDGYAEYYSKKNSADNELAGALMTLNEKNDEITQAKDDLAKQEKLLADAAEEIKTARVTLAVSEETLKKEQSDFYSIYNKNLKELDTQIAALSAQLDNIDPVSLSEQKAGLEGHLQLLQAEKALIDSDRAVTDAKYAVSDAEINGAISAKQQEIADLEEQLKTDPDPALLQQKQDAENELILLLAEKDEYDKIKAEEYAALDARQTANLAALNKATDDIIAVETVIQTAAEYTAYMESLQSGLEQLKASKLPAEQQFAEGFKQISDAEELLNSKEEELNAGIDAISAGKEEIAEGERKLSEGYDEYYINKADAEQKFSDSLDKLKQSSKDLDEAREEIGDIPYPEVFSLTRTSNEGYVRFENDTGIVDGLSKIFPIFFFLVAALVCSSTMTRMVAEQRTQIGVFKAMGYSTTRITVKYMSYSGSAALFGAMIGFIAGTVIFPQTIWMAYGIAYNITSLKYVIDPVLAIISVVVSLACSAGATFFACQKELVSNPAELIRPKHAKAGQRILLEKIPHLWKRIKFLQKISIRNITGNKKRFFMMLLGIGGCTALMLTGFGIRDSISGIAKYQYSEIILYDCSVNFTEDMNDNKQALFKEKTEDKIGDILFVSESSVDIYSGSKSKSATLAVTEGDKIDLFVSLHEGDKELKYPAQGQALISKKLSSDLNIKKGDRVKVRDSDNNEYSYKVSGIFDNYVGNYIFTAPDTSGSSEDKNSGIKTAYINFAEGIDPGNGAALIKNESNVGNVTISADSEKQVGDAMSSLNYIVILITVCAAALAFIVLYNLMNIDITERLREISTVKVLGFFAKETAGYVFRENIVLVLIGTAAGLIAGKLLHIYVMSQINVDYMYFDVRISVISFIISFILTMIFALAVGFIMYKKLRKINMTESLKSIE